MRQTPIGQKWVIHYSCSDGQRGMGLTDDFKFLPQMIALLLEDGAKNIYIIDKTFYKDDEDGKEQRPWLQGRG